MFPHARAPPGHAHRRHGAMKFRENDTGEEKENIHLCICVCVCGSVVSPQAVQRGTRRSLLFTVKKGKREKCVTESERVRRLRVLLPRFSRARNRFSFLSARRVEYYFLKWIKR